MNIALQTNIIPGKQLNGIEIERTENQFATGQWVLHINCNTMIQWLYTTSICFACIQIRRIALKPEDNPCEYYPIELRS